MKLIGIRPAGTRHTTVAILDGQQAIPLAPVEEFWAAPHDAVHNHLSSGAEPVDLDTVVIVPPVPAGARVICAGLNYKAHVAEGSYSDEVLPEYPTLFGRWTYSLSVSDESVQVPADEVGLDWEGEVAAFVGGDLSNVDADTARSAVFGYAAFNDITARRAQKLTSQWTLGKNADGSGPLGPIVTADEVGDLRDGLRLQTRVNGTVAQDGNTRDMIFEVGEVLAHISKTFTLRAGDIIATGTPDGVGYARTPQWLLHDGDVVEVEIERLGTVRTYVTEAPAS